MSVVHDPADGSPRTIATDVEYAEGLLSQARGVMFRSSLPEGFAMVFPFDRPKRRGIHTLFVFVPIDVVWLADGAVTKVTTMRPWRGVGFARADTVVELPAGAADAVAVGDRLRVEAG